MPLQDLMLIATIETWSLGIDHWFNALGGPVEGLARLGLAALFGALIGLEREVRGRQAGFRTCLLVCLGSAMVMLVSIQFAIHKWSPQGPGVNVNVDPARIAYAVMTGIGFLGAGVIVRSNTGSVRGLTTAAGLWCVAAIGLSIGMGMYLMSAVCTVLVVLALWLLEYVGGRLPRARYRMMTVRMKYFAGCMQRAVELFKKHGMRVIDARMQRDDIDPSLADVTVQITFFDSKRVNAAERAIEADPELQLMSSQNL